MYANIDRKEMDMTQNHYYLAVDLGAESGRVIRGTVTEDSISYEQMHRFSNGPAQQGGSLKWDFNALFSNILEGLKIGIEKTDGPILGIAVDSWGVDFGLIGADGSLLADPYHYRDSRTDEMMDFAFSKMPRREVYQKTGLQFMQFNSIYQLLAYQQQEPQLLEKTKHVIMMADLVAYHLSDTPFVEYTLGSTSQLMDMAQKKWCQELFDTFGLNPDWMPPVVMPGTVAAKLSDSIAQKLGCDPIPVIAVGSHDTASAIAAVPASGENWAYLSSGTWSLLGAEVPSAIINDKTYEYEFTNEGGVNDTIRLLKNIMGLWIVQECRRDWQSKGQDYSYDQITQMARDAKPFAGMINPNDLHFFAPGNMPERIFEYLEKTGQKGDFGQGELIRLTLESLAMYYRFTIEQVEDCLGRKVEVLHIVGGGSKNTLLNQFTADALGIEVVAGPVEATALGNISLQAMATGKIDSLQKARDIIAKSFDLNRYKPEGTDKWAARYEEFKKHIAK